MLAQQQRLRSCMYSALDSRPSRSHARDRSCSKAGSGKPGCAAPKASEKKPKDPSKKSLISSDFSAGGPEQSASGKPPPPPAAACAKQSTPRKAPSEISSYTRYDEAGGGKDKGGSQKYSYGSYSYSYYDADKGGQGTGKKK